MYIFCAILSPTQINLISIARACCRFTVLDAIPTAVALSQWTGVLGCGCPRLFYVVQNIMPSWQLRNSSPSSASAADATKNFIICVLTWKAPLRVIGCPSLGIDPMKKYPHVQLRAFGLDRYDTSEWMFMIMSDLWKRIFASGLEAR